MNLSELSGSYETLTEEQRTSLADLLQVRNEYNQALLILNQMRIEVLRNYTKAGEERLVDYATMVIAPIRRRMSKQQTDLTKDAFDVEGLKSMAPMILMALVGNINVSLLLTTMGLEPDSIELLVKLTTDFFKEGM